MAYHPHVHYLVPGGALSRRHAVALPPLGGVAPACPRLSTALRGKCKAALTPAVSSPSCRPGLAQGMGDPLSTAGLVRSSPTSHPYLPDCLDQQLLGNTRSWAGPLPLKKRTGSGWKRLTLPAEAFFIVPPACAPQGFPKVRAYGLLSSSRRKVLPQISPLLVAGPSPPRQQ